MTPINLLEAIIKVANNKKQSHAGLHITEPEPNGFTTDFTDEEWNQGVELPEGLSITPDEVRAILTEHVAELNLKGIQYQRAKAYPDLGEQLDYIYHNGLDKWKTDIVDPVKKKYPKPE